MSTIIPILRLRIFISFLFCFCFLGIKADDSGEINLSLQGYIKDLDDAKTDESKAYILARIIAEAGRSDTKLADEYLSQFKTLVSQSNIPIVKVRYFKTRGVINYYKKMEVDSIMHWYDLAYAELDKHNIEDTKMKINLHNNKAIIFVRDGDKEAAVNEYLAGIETISRSNDKLYRHETLLIANFANLLYKNSQFEEALVYLEKAIEANKKYEKELGQHSEYYEYILINHARTLKELNRLDEAEKSINDILAYKNTPTVENNFAKALLGTLYSKNDQSELARKMIDEAIKETALFNIGIEPEVSAYLALAKLELDENNLSSSIQSIDHIFDLYKNAGEEVKVSEIYSVMSKALEKSGRYEESLHNLKQYQSIVEKEKAEAAKLKHGTFKSRISMIEKKYQINELEIQQKLQESKIYVLVVAFLLSIILIFFIFLMYKRKKSHNKALLLINQEVREANANVIAASKTKENFLSRMSHEMCTPMNAVIGITNILLDENPTKKQSEHLSNLKFSGEILLNIINEVLDFSKITSDKLKIDRKPIHIQKLLDKTISSFQQANTNKNVEIFQDQNLKDLTHLVSLDQTRLIQILSNLIGNAIKFTDKGSIILRSGILQNTSDMVKIIFQIEDTGIGIPKDKLESIFESFSQVNNEINREHEGTGLGLSITKKLVELKGGKLEVTSTEGKGSTFTFTLEFGKEDKIEKIEANSPTKDKIFQTGIEGKKILLVEDNKLNQLVAKKILSKFKVEISLAENGQEAVDMVQKERYDLILMDIHMPIMDGIEATKSIRALKDPFFQQIPIVALSADAYSDQVQATTESGMNDYLAKPFKPEDLFQKIKTNMEKAWNARGTV